MCEINTLESLDVAEVLTDAFDESRHHVCFGRDVDHAFIKTQVRCERNSEVAYFTDPFQYIPINFVIGQNKIPFPEKRYGRTFVCA